MARPQYLPDNFTLALVAVVTLASLWPAEGGFADFVEKLTTFAIALLFFLHGAKLSREAILGGIMHWRLHILVFASTFIMFPIVGLALRPVLAPLVTPELYTGVIYLCCLPATVQSAIAFTSIARGNIPAAVCSASASTLLGVFITPLLVGLFIHADGAVAGSFSESVTKILLQLMAPFVAGHLLRPWIGGFVKRHAKVLTLVDRSSILLVVYGAFSAAVIEGLWKQVPPMALAGLLVVLAIILGIAICFTTVLSRRLGFSKADEITIVFAGSKKSLASGIPMAQVLFTPAAVGAIVLPLMLFHQMQLMLCSVLAQRYARRQDEPVGMPPQTSA
jgi:sodium/bile acid cotransporter 7